MYECVFSSASQYIENCTQIIQRIWFFIMCVFYSLYLNIFILFLRLSLESNLWNSLTKFYSIKLLMTAGVSNILCPFTSMPSIDSSSPDYPCFPSVSWTSVSLLLTSFHWCCFLLTISHYIFFYVITFFPTSLISSLFQRFIILPF